MLLIPNAIFTQYLAHLAKRQIPINRFAEYKKWLRYYLDFCDKYPVPDSKSERVRLFCDKLRDKKQNDEKRQRAAHAISLYFEMPRQHGVLTGGSRTGNVSTESADNVIIKTDVSTNFDEGLSCGRDMGGGITAVVAKPKRPVPQAADDVHYVFEATPRYAAFSSRRSHYSAAGYQEKSDSPEWDDVLAKLAGEIKVRHYSRNALKTYALWSRQFQRFLKNKPPQELSTNDVREYLTYLAVTCKVAASTQNQELHIG